LVPDLYNGSILIKESSGIRTQLREFIKENSRNLKKNTNTKTKSITCNQGLYKERGIPYSVQVASAIAGYRKKTKARI
jgi:hypothetical protein